MTSKSKPGFNPLLDTNKQSSQTMPISVTAATVISPITRKPMTLAYCGEIPVYVDLEAKVVLPIRD